MEWTTRISLHGNAESPARVGEIWTLGGNGASFLSPPKLQSEAWRSRDIQIRIFVSLPSTLPPLQPPPLLAPWRISLRQYFLPRWTSIRLSSTEDARMPSWNTDRRSEAKADSRRRLRPRRLRRRRRHSLDYDWLTSELRYGQVPKLTALPGRHVTSPGKRRILRYRIDEVDGVDAVRRFPLVIVARCDPGCGRMLGTAPTQFTSRRTHVSVGRPSSRHKEIYGPSSRKYMISAWLSLVSSPFVHSWYTKYALTKLNLNHLIIKYIF